MDDLRRGQEPTMAATAAIHGSSQREQRRRRKRQPPTLASPLSFFSFASSSSTVGRQRLFTCGALLTAFMAGLTVLPGGFFPVRPVNAIAELEDLLLLAMMQNLASGGAGAGAGGGNALTGAFSGLGRGLGCSRAGARIQHDAGPGSMPSNEVTGSGGGQQLHPGGAASEGGARAISVDPNPAPLIKAGEETNNIMHNQKMMIASTHHNNNNISTHGGTNLTPFLDFEILPGFVINGSSSSGSGNEANSGGATFPRRQLMSSGQSIDPNNAPSTSVNSGAADSGANSAEIEQIVQITSNNAATGNVTVTNSNGTTNVGVSLDKTSTPVPLAGKKNGGLPKVAIKISAKPANLIQEQAPGAAANADKNKLTSMFGWDQQDQTGARRRKRSMQPVYEGQAREGRRGEPSFQRGSKRHHQTPGVVSNIGPSTAQLKRTTGRLIESRLETLVDKISAMNAASQNGNGQHLNLPFNSPAGGMGGGGGGGAGGGTLGGYIHPEGFAGGIPAPQYYGQNAAVNAAEQPSRVYPPGFPRNPFDSPAANQAPWPDSQVAYVQPGQYQTSPQSAQQVLNNFLRFLPRLLEAARK